MSIQQKLIDLYERWIPDSHPQSWGESSVAKCLKGQMKFAKLWPLVYDIGSVHVYDQDEGIWSEIDKDTIRMLALKFNGVRSMGGKGGRAISVTSSMTKGIYECLRLDTDVYRPGFFSEAVEGIPFNNCLVTLDNGEFKEVPHNPDNRLRAKFQFDYKPGLVPEAFLKQLHDVFPDEDREDKIKCLQEILGTAMAGVAPNFQRSLIATGGGSNGKSTVFDILSSIFPSEFVTSISPQQWSDQYYRALLHSSLLNLVQDMQDTKILSNSDFKPIVSGDPVMASYKHRDPFEFRCRAAHMFVCNELPAVVDFSYGYRRRFLILEFNKQFKPGDGGFKTKDEIVNDILASDRSAIGCWALEGYKRVVEQGGYTEPASHEKAMNKWLAQSDPVADFVSSVCTKVEENGETDEHLYKEFKQWQKTSGHKRAWAFIDFRRRLEQLGVGTGEEGERLLSTGTETKESWIN